jgi:tRNA pseudouridine38-40 synthase
MPAERFVPALNSLLPRDIRVRSACDAAPDFHARFSARARAYRYFLAPGAALPWELRYAWQIWRTPDIETLNSYARFLHGEMDCAVFAGAGDKSLSTRRYLYHAFFFYEGERLVFEIRANAFLLHMVRSIVGTLLRAEEKRLAPEAFAEILASGDRGRAGPTAPPQGLFLWKVDY